MEPETLKPEDTKQEDIKSKNPTHSNDIQPRTINKLLRFSIVLLFTISIIALCLGAFMLIRGFTMPVRPNTWDGLGKAIATLVGEFLVSGVLPMFITGICGLRYKKGKSKGKLTASWIWATISFAVYMLLIILIFKNYTVGTETSFTLDSNQPPFYINTPIIITALVTISPISLFMVGCYLEQQSQMNKVNQENIKYSQNAVKGKNSETIINHKKLTIAAVAILVLTISLPIAIPAIAYLSSIAGQDTFTKIEVDEGHLLTLNEFNNELWSRGFLYDLPGNTKDLVTADKILVEDPNYDYSRDFSVSTGLKNRSNFGQWGDQKFPVYVYDSYVTLIQKSPQTASYYNKGPEDWTISWFIYNINGQTFAAIGGESGLNDVSYGGEDLFETDQRMIVAEEGKITTYNRGGNYFAYGGCIEKTWSTAQRTSIPKMSDQYNSNCAKIKVVDRVDAKTLDALAKKIAEE